MSHIGMSFILILTQKSLVAGRTTSKCLGIGSAEQSWSDMKQIKDRKKSNRGGTSLEKQAILYSSTRLNEAQIKQTYMMIFRKSFFKSFFQ